MNSNTLIEYFESKVSKNAIKALEELDENLLDGAESLKVIPLKNKWIGLLLGIIGGWFWIFGIDRLYKGDKWLAAFKLIFTLQIYLFPLIVPLILPYSLEAGKEMMIDFWSSGISGVIKGVMSLINLDLQVALTSTIFYAKIFACCVIIWLISMIIGFFWVLVDPIIVYFGIKRDNGRKLLKAISQIQSEVRS